MSHTKLAWPPRLLTLADWEALPLDESHRLECAEGILVVTPKPPPRHQHLRMRLGSVLDTALGPGFTVVPDVEVLLEAEPLTIRAPDLIAVTSTDYRAATGRFTGDQVRLAIEIISPGSRRTDRVTKASEYADAGIPEYWVIDPDAPSADIYRLDGHAYVHRLTATTPTTAPACGTTLHLDFNTLR